MGIIVGFLVPSTKILLNDQSGWPWIFIIEGVSGISHIPPLLRDVGPILVSE